MMDKMQDQNAEDFEEIYNADRSPEDTQFDTYISQLQQIVIDPAFEKVLTQFMAQHWAAMDQQQKQKEEAIFQQYQQQVQAYLTAHMTQRHPKFTWPLFNNLFHARRQLVDEQLLDTLLSLQDVENFKAFIKDYRNAYEEVEMFKVLTIKSSKAPQSKMVKGKDNIFAGGAGGGAGGLFEKGLKPLPKKKEVKQKTEDELMVPEMILTVKPMRKG